MALDGYDEWYKRSCDKDHMDNYFEISLSEQQNRDIKDQTYRITEALQKVVPDAEKQMKDKRIDKFDVGMVYADASSTVDEDKDLMVTQGRHTEKPWDSHYTAKLLLRKWIGRHGMNEIHNRVKLYVYDREARDLTMLFCR